MASLLVNISKQLRPDGLSKTGVNSRRKTTGYTRTPLLSHTLRTKTHRRNPIAALHVVVNPFCERLYPGQDLDPTRPPTDQGHAFARQVIRGIYAAEWTSLPWKLCRLGMLGQRQWFKMPVAEQTTSAVSMNC